jgi:hypothetical protein
MKYKDYLKKILILKKNNMETENDCFNETNIETEDDCFKNDYNNIFDEVFYINLEHRVDRKLEIESELDKIGLKYKRFNAIKNKNGAIGCAKSHLELIKYARDNKLKNILIFEDDFQFIISKDIFWKNINYFINKCVDYDILLLGSNTMKSNNYDDNSELFFGIDDIGNIKGIPYDGFLDINYIDFFVAFNRGSIIPNSLTY